MGVLGLVDPIEAIEALLFKWAVHVLKPTNSNLLKFFKFQLSQYQPHLGGGEVEP
jgi:hypothetical protein